MTDPLDEITRRFQAKLDALEERHRLRCDIIRRRHLAALIVVIAVPAAVLLLAALAAMKGCAP